MKLAFELTTNLCRFVFYMKTTITGEVTGVFGPSGAGKSTLFRMLLGQMPDVKGRLRLNDRELLNSDTGVNVPINERRIGCVFQDPCLFPHMNVEKNLKFAQQFNQTEQHDIPFDQVVSLLELDNLLTARTSQLSGGEQQRVAIARAILSGPELLLLDEPFKGLDKQRANRALLLLRDLREKLGLDMLLISHELERIFTLTDELLLIDQGELVGQGRYLDLVADPENHNVLGGETHLCPSDYAEVAS